MLDIKYIRDNPEKTKKGVAAKQYDPKLVDEVLEADKERRELLVEIEQLRSKRNKLAKEKNIEEGKKIKKLLQEKEPELKKVKAEYVEVLNKIPNLPSSDSPIGKEEKDNVEIRKWGKIKKFGFKPKDHILIGKDLDLIDVETSGKVSGARFYYLKNEAVLLQFALVQFVFETLTDEKIIKELAKKTNNPSSKLFSPVVPPVFIKKDVAIKMDRYYKDESYYLEKDNLVLVGSAEHSLGPMHMDQTFNEKHLPIRYIGYSTSFRREAGTYGKDMGGILRTHQFDKLEMETFTLPENGLVEQDLIVAIQEHLIQQLGIPYQVVNICTGDMGKPDYRQLDINCWMPGQGKYRETHTSDYMTDYQSRRLGTRVNTKEGNVYVHMNDATAFAIGRTLIAILENYQQKDGSVIIPEVLRKWVGKDKIDVKKN